MLWGQKGCLVCLDWCILPFTNILLYKLLQNPCDLLRSCNYYCWWLNYCVILTAQCYLKIQMISKSQKYKSFIKNLTHATILCCSVKWNNLNLYAVMKQESFYILLLWSHLVLNLAQREELTCKAEHISYNAITLRRENLKIDRKCYLQEIWPFLYTYGWFKDIFKVFFFIWVVSLISDCNYFMPMHNGLNALYAFWDAKWMKKRRWKFMPAVKWQLEHTAIPTSQYSMKIKYFLKPSEVFYSWFPLSCLDSYHYLVVIDTSF